MKQKQKPNLETGSVGKLLFRLAVPAIIAQIINVLYNVIDRMFIGHIPEIGHKALTGVGVTFPILMLISAFSALVGMGGAPKAAIKLGEGDHPGAEKTLGNCVSTLLFFSAVLTAVILLLKDKLLFAFGASSETIGYASGYLTIYACGTIFVQIVLGLNMFISAQGFATVSMLSTVIGAVCNIILDPILIFGFNLGVAGAAVATVLSQAVSAVWVLAFLCGKKTGLKVRISNLRLDPKIILPVLALGVSPFIMQVTESVISICFNSSLQHYGGDFAVGAMTILASVMQFAMLPLQGLTQGAQPIISFNFGAGNLTRVKKAFRLLALSCVCYSTLIWTLCIFTPAALVSMFTNSPQLAEISVWALRIYMAVVLIFGIQIACQQTFIALGQAAISAFLALLRKVILLIPLIYLLPGLLGESLLGWLVPRELLSMMDAPFQVAAVYLAEPIADIIAVTVTLTLFLRNFNKILKTRKAALQVGENRKKEEPVLP